MVGVNEDYVASNRNDYREPELSQFDKDLIGAAVRIEVPFAGRYQLRQIAGILRAYADEIDRATRDHDKTDRSMLMTLKLEAKIINRRIRDVCDLTGKGKVPKPYQRNRGGA